MASELQLQLERIKAKSITTNNLYSDTPSLYFDKKTAGSIDIEAVYDAAVNGLITLSQYDERFSNFLTTILHPSSQQLQRELKTKEENALLDSQINELFDLLSLFCTNENSHKVLEYLIRRYRVHELNVDSLIQSMLPCHDSKVCSIIHFRFNYTHDTN
jgi:U3 small nucleolar RNA-associated protein 10